MEDGLNSGAGMADKLTTAPKKTPVVMLELDQQLKQLTNLSAELNLLEDRLSSVLTPVAGAESEKRAETQTPPMTVASRIQLHNELIAITRKRIEVLLERLEI